MRGCARARVRVTVLTVLFSTLKNMMKNDIWLSDLITPLAKSFTFFIMNLESVFHHFRFEKVAFVCINLCKVYSEAIQIYAN